MDFTDFECSENDNNRRLDKVIKSVCQKYNLNMYELIRKNLIRLNNKKTTGETKISTGDKINIASFLLENSQQIPEKKEISYDIPLEILYQNENILVINKPKNINVQNATKNDISISTIVEQKYNSGKSLSFKSAPLHRLDKQTTGILLCSQSLKGATEFSNFLRDNKKDESLQKIYVGIVENKLENPIIFEDYIDTTSNQNDSFKTVKITNDESKDFAVTKAIPLAYGKFQTKDVTLVQFNILTGVKHQIRCQSSSKGFPLLGDTSYGGSRIQNPDFARNTFFLHAIYLKLPENNSISTKTEFYCPIPQDFKKILKIALINWNEEIII